VPGGRRAAALAAALAVALGGCSGGDGGETSATAPPPAPEPPPVTVRVVDGDTERPVAGAAVRARGPEGPVRARTDARGVARLPHGVRAVVASSPRHDAGSAPVRARRARVALYQPRLQSPEYGGGPARTRYVPAVKVPPPRGEADWTFDAITLVEFPPAVKDGLAVFGVNSGRVFALDVDTGRVRWEARQKSYIASTPAIHEGRVYVTSMDGALTVYRASDGRRLWGFSTGGSPVESSPLIVGDLVYFGTWDGGLHAVDIRTRRERWRFQAPADIKGSAAAAGDGLIVVGDYAGRVHGLDAETGAARWTYTGGQRFYGGPGVSGTTAVIGDVGGAVIALDTRTGRERWRHTTGGYVYASPAIARGTVFIGSYDGRFQALDLETGRVRWSHDAGGRISGSATVVGDVVYTAVLAAPGEPRVTFGLDTATGRVRWRGDDGRYSPAVAAGRSLILVGTRLVYGHHAPPP
jgi:outer membrane protein assembly factor BamB